MSEEFDFERIKNKAIEQLKADKSLSGKDRSVCSIVGEYFGIFSICLQKTKMA